MYFASTVSYFLFG